MKTKIFIAIILGGTGISLAIISLENVVYAGVNNSNLSVIMFSCILMICSALFKYRDELDEIEGVLGNEKMLLDEESEKISDLKRNKGKEASGWRIRDIEYRLRELENRVK